MSEREKRSDLACFVRDLAKSQRAPGAAKVSIFKKFAVLTYILRWRGPVLILNHEEKRSVQYLKPSTAHMQPMFVILSSLELCICSWPAIDWCLNMHFLDMAHLPFHPGLITCIDIYALVIVLNYSFVVGQPHMNCS